jgi:hypothetical protein
MEKSPEQLVAEFRECVALNKRCKKCFVRPERCEQEYLRMCGIMQGQETFDDIKDGDFNNHIMIGSKEKYVVTRREVCFALFARNTLWEITVGKKGGPFLPKANEGVRRRARDLRMRVYTGEIHQTHSLESLYSQRREERVRKCLMEHMRDSSVAEHLQAEIIRAMDDKGVTRRADVLKARDYLVNAGLLELGASRKAKTYKLTEAGRAWEGVTT